MPRAEQWFESRRTQTGCFVLRWACESLNQFCQFSLAAGKHFAMQRAPMRVHGHNCGKILYLEFPDSLRSAELFYHVNVPYLFDALGQHLCRATDAVQIHTAMFFARRQGSVAHAPFA